MIKPYEPEWGAEDITEEDDFIDKFETAFPEFVLPPSEIVKIYQKNERYKKIKYSLTPELDQQLDECMDRMSEVME